ncbi:ImmA/IrrE family metallo-endopeptidase [Bacteroidota bacterium]
MKTVIIFCFYITILNSSINYVLCQSTFEPYNSKEELEFDVKKIISDFDLYMKDLGIILPYIPGVNVQTAPFLIKWDEPNKAIILPYWDDLLTVQIEIFNRWRGDNAEEFFISMFNWFFVPHELGHFMNPLDNSLSPYKREKAANEFAISFLISDEKNQEKIKYIVKSLQEIMEILPKIDFNNMSEEEYFNANYSQLGNNPDAYGYFQFKFILDILNNKENINILKYFEKEV